MHTSNISFHQAFHAFGQNTKRIDWFGEVTRHGLYGGLSPMVQLVLSSWGNNESTDSKSKNRITTISVPIAYLRLFRIGDLWCNGRIVGTDETLSQTTFENLSIDDTTVEVVPAGLPFSQRGGAPLYPLPFSEFGAHRDHTGAFCARVQVADDVTLVIPCMELVRFYFGASGLLLKRLFSGALANTKLYASAKINLNTGIASLDLAPGLPGVAASTVGRIAFDRQARKAVHWIAHSGLVASANRERHYSRTTFPFTGQTNLTTQGRWINQSSHRVFLAERLLRCTHPFPFQTLFYTSHLNLSSVRKFTCTVPESSARPNSDSNTTVEIAEARVDSGLQPAIVTTAEDVDCPFPDLVDKRVRRVCREHSWGNRHTPPQSPLGTGENSSTSDIREAEVTTENLEDGVEEIYPDTVETMFTEINSISEQMDNRVRLLHPRNMGDRPWEMSFVQANTLTVAGDSRMEQIWAARLIFNLSHYTDSLLLLVRQGAQCSGNKHSDNDQFALFRYQAEHDPEGDKLERLLLDFANMESRQSTDGDFISHDVKDMGHPRNSDYFWSFLMSMLAKDSAFGEEQSHVKS